MSKGYFSYIRVSTQKQGQNGTSLSEQQEAIRRYAERWNLKIIREFEEKETAAKGGRPIFSQMLRELKQGKANGVIIHKIDRSARNLKDWAELGELIDRGIEVHFANENLDLYSRGGRLSADIQAVVAADYIRNLREEVKKGFYGRLKQGFYPRPAPLGYLDRGKGQPKEIDPVQGPLVKKAFELYATGKWSLDDLVEKMYSLGLRNKQGTRVSRTGMSHFLHNPFYIGLMRIQSKGEIYSGQHSPIITRDLFNQVQLVLKGRNINNKQRRVTLFRRFLTCGFCNLRLIGEIQKGYTYYRCHTKGCQQKTIREEAVEEEILSMLRNLRFSEIENRFIRKILRQDYQNVRAYKETQSKALLLQLEQIQGRLSKLVDAYIEGMLDQATYLLKKNDLVTEERTLKSSLENINQRGHEALQRVENFLELINNAYSSYNLANPEKKRELLKIITSNLTVKDKTLIIKLHYPFQIVADHQSSIDGAPKRTSHRTLSILFDKLCTYFVQNDLALQPNNPHNSADMSDTYLAA